MGRTARARVSAVGREFETLAARDLPGGTLDPALRRSLSRLAEEHGDLGPIEIHDLKSRRGRRHSHFLGRCTPSRFGMVVHWGVVLKRANLRRAAELLALHRALWRAVRQPEELPAVPRILSARVEDGWVALEAWPGLMMASNPDLARRARYAVRVARLLASLEGSPRAARLWPRRRWTADDEIRRLGEVWSRAEVALPDWVAELAGKLGRSGTPLVPAHRDLNSEQVIVDPLAADPTATARRWIDWDQAALVPAGLDLGNLLAHERLATLVQDSAPTDFLELRSDVLASYRRAGGRATEAELAAWEAVACLRLAGLSLQRARGDDPVTRNPAWLQTPSSRRGEAVAMRRAAKHVLSVARVQSRSLRGM